MIGALELPSRGFSFNLHARNMALQGKGMNIPKVTKTGTTIAGVLFKDGVVLGADTRATAGTIVADKNCDKIHYIAPNIQCCGAGTAADTENVTELIASKMELHRLNSGRSVRLSTAVTLLKQMLFKYQGHLGAALVLGGVDVDGPALYTIHPHGSTDKLPFVTMGSGSLAAMSVFEARWRENMTEEEAKELVRDGILAGIFNDLGSGSNVDLCVITRHKTERLRNYLTPNDQPPKELSYDFAHGTTPVLKEKIIPLEVVVEFTTPSTSHVEETMEF